MSIYINKIHGNFNISKNEEDRMSPCAGAPQLQQHALMAYLVSALFLPTTHLLM